MAEGVIIKRYHLGVMQYNTQGTAKDENQAVENSKKAANQELKKHATLLRN
ncbi:hypothetical protein HMPREF1425_01415 [Helicobacter pylori GAM71Ai]|nr:hypothetical protein HMPREF1425_01415 [Helicobacter pylori GAM71Ai]